MHMHILQHVPFETPGCITAWLKEHGVEHKIVKLYENAGLPAQEDVVWLTVMGGPMGVGDEAQYPWLADEKKLIRNTADRGGKILGICLGAQLIAAALGAEVKPGRHKEIGWFDVTLNNSARTSGRLEGLPAVFKAFHWHGDTFDLPEGSQPVGVSDGCPNQGFLIEDSITALQFHLELNRPSIERLIYKCSSDMVPGPYVQSPHEISDLTAIHEAQANSSMYKLLDSFFAG